MNHPLQCRCGTVKILDAQGGTDVVQTRPANLTFTHGQDTLACMRLTPKGLLRWYAACCNTPIGNTVANYRMPFVGLVHSGRPDSHPEGDQPRRAGKAEERVTDE